MGNFYANLTVVGPDESAVIAALGSHPAFVAPTNEKATVVFHADEEETLPSLGQELSRTLSASVLGVTVHDDDFLGVLLWVDGDVVYETTVPDPAEYFDMPPGALTGTPSDHRHDSGVLVSALGRGERAAVDEVLGGDYVFATERHRALTNALALPVTAVGWGYRYLQEDLERFVGPPLTRT